MVQTPAGAIAVHDNDSRTAMRGLMERLILTKSLEPPIQPTKDFQKLKAYKHFRKNRVVLSPISRQKFVDHYTGRKRHVYENAKESLHGRPLSVVDSHIRGFVKDEKFDYTLKPNQVPRIIQPRHPRYNMELGRFLRPLESIIFREIDRMFGHNVIMKGYNTRQRGEIIHDHWCSLNDPIAIGIDASRFDQHVSRSALRFEHSIYKMFFVGAERDLLKRILQMQLKTKGVIRTADGVIKYRLNRGRCSGDYNTSLGNGLIMSSLVYEYMNGKEINYRFINDGDDGVLFIERSDLHLLDDLRPWFVDYGFSMTTEEPVDVLEHVEFCQCKPVSCGGYIMCRDPTVVTRKDAYTTKPMNTQGHWNFYRGAVGTCGINAMGGIPVVQNFYDMLRRGTIVPKKGYGPLDSGLWYQTQGMVSERSEPSNETRLSFYKAFDITPDTQIVLEKWYDGQVPLYQPSSGQLNLDYREETLKYNLNLHNNHD